jgi:hypothetical protein
MGLDSVLSALAGKGRTGRVADALVFLTLVRAGTAGLRDAVGISGIVSDKSTKIARQRFALNRSKEKEKELGVFRLA